MEVSQESLGTDEANLDIILCPAISAKLDSRT